MASSRRITEHLESELRMVEDRLRGMGTEPTPLQAPAPLPEGAHLGDFHDRAVAGLATEMLYETRSRLLKRRANLREALRRLRDGSYGHCGDCDEPIPEKRLLAMPEATLCVPCQEQRERGSRDIKPLDPRSRLPLLNPSVAAREDDW